MLARAGGAGGAVKGADGSGVKLCAAVVFCWREILPCAWSFLGVRTAREWSLVWSGLGIEQCRDVDGLEEGGGL